VLGARGGVYARALQGRALHRGRSTCGPPSLTDCSPPAAHAGCTAVPLMTALCSTWSLPVFSCLPQPRLLKLVAVLEGALTPGRVQGCSRELMALLTQERMDRWAGAPRGRIGVEGSGGAAQLGWLQHGGQFPGRRCRGKCRPVAAAVPGHIHSLLRPCCKVDHLTSVTWPCWGATAMLQSHQLVMWSIVHVRVHAFPLPTPVTLCMSSCLVVSAALHHTNPAHTSHQPPKPLLLYIQCQVSTCSLCHTI
jgi:hypothetical protein